MKRLLIIAIALVTLQATAQDTKEKQREQRKERASKMKDISAKDIAQLQTKKMTLHLDLTDAQQNKISKINLANAKARKAKMEARLKAKDNKDAKRPSQEERLKMMNERLDAQIAQKRELKSILTDEQFKKWERTKRTQGKRAMRGKKGKRRGPHEKKKMRTEEQND